jgi:hypothetical protein
MFLLGKSTKPREGERRRKSIPEYEAMEEGGRPKFRRPGVEAVVWTVAVGLGQHRRRLGCRVGGEGHGGRMGRLP